MEAAARRLEREPGSVRLVAVSKFRTVDEMREAIDAGVADFGENRVHWCCSLWVSSVRNEMGLLDELGVELTERGNVWRDAAWVTSVPGIFTAGDMQRGQSLIVWAIAEGRSCARAVDTYLMGYSDLPAPLDHIGATQFFYRRRG